MSRVETEHLKIQGIKGQFRKSTIDAMRQVAGDFGVTLTVIFDEGQKYITTVLEGHQYISLTSNTNQVMDLSKFWRKVEKIEQKQKSLCQANPPPGCTR